MFEEKFFSDETKKNGNFITNTAEILYSTPGMEKTTIRDKNQSNQPKSTPFYQYKLGQNLEISSQISKESPVPSDVEILPTDILDKFEAIAELQQKSSLDNKNEPASLLNSSMTLIGELNKVHQNTKTVSRKNSSKALNKNIEYPLLITEEL